ncbi:MAG: phosphoribosyltransferase [Candidatus Bilamarchaeaceae archaeon]
MKLIEKNNKYRIYEVKKKGLPKNTYIVCSNDTRSILYNPQIAGKKLHDRMEKVSKIFIDLIRKKTLDKNNKENVVEFVLLSGGLYYRLADSFRKLCGYALPQCFLGIKRQRVEGTEGSFQAVSTYENFEALPKKAVVIVGDTIATGATMIRALHDLERAAEENKGKIKKLIVCSLACSTDGARKLKDVEEKFRKKNKEFKLYLIVAEQLYHLMPDGTDLRFLWPDSIMPDETKEYTLKRYGKKLGKEMKCAVFDWGTRCKNPKKHYEEFLEFAEFALKNLDLDSKGKNEIKRMVDEVKKEIKNY